MNLKVVRHFTFALVLILFASGLSNALAESMSGKILHVWSHDINSSYTLIHIVNKKLRKGDTYRVEQTVYAANYSGNAGVTLLEVQVTTGRGKTKWYSIYWYGRNEIEIYGSSSHVVNVDMSKPHRYAINVSKNQVKFYVDGKIVYSEDASVRKVQQVNTGRWDKGSTYDLYIDDVRDYWNGNLMNEETFEDGRDDYYTEDVLRGNGDSSKEILNSESVPEFPFLEPLLKLIWGVEV